MNASKLDMVLQEMRSLRTLFLVKLGIEVFMVLMLLAAYFAQTL